MEAPEGDVLGSRMLENEICGGSILGGVVSWVSASAAPLNAIEAINKRSNSLMMTPKNRTGKDITSDHFQCAIIPERVAKGFIPR